MGERERKKEREITMGRGSVCSLVWVAEILRLGTFNGDEGKNW